MAVSLPSDILDLISKKLTLDPDYTRFRSVCKSWRSVAPKRSSKSLFLIRHQSSNFIIGTKFFNLISFQTNEIVAVSGPPKSSSPSSILNNNEMVCIGSSLGWIALIHHLTKSILLYNPVTNCIVNLPDFPKCSVHLTDRKCYERIDFAMSSDPVLSPTQCVVLIMCDCSEKFILCKVGKNCKTWTPFGFPSFLYYADRYLDGQWGKRACFYNGKIYFTLKGRLVKHSEVIHFDDRVEKEQYNNDESYLVEMDGNLLLVLVTWPHSLKEGYSFRLYNLVKKRVTGRYSGYIEDIDSLEKVDSLGDKAIFLSHKTSFCVTASEYSGCKKNSVYYIAKYSVGKRTILKMRVHDMNDHSDVIMKDSVATSRRDWELCAWFAPTLQP